MAILSAAARNAVPTRHQAEVTPNQVFSWRRLAAQGALTAAGAEEEVVPASDYRALQIQYQRLLGKKTMEAEILKEALEIAGGQKKHLLRALSMEVRSNTLVFAPE
jgi:transposase